MDFRELQDTLQKLTKSKISLTQIGKALDIKLSTVSTRVKSGSELKFNELKKIEEFFNVSLMNNDNIVQSSATFINPKIQKMVKESGIGMAAYGIYWALIEEITMNGIKKGEEKNIADKLNVEIKDVCTILNDYKLFKISNNSYRSIFPEHNLNAEEYFAPKFEDVKADILKEVEKMLQDRGVILK